jgi:2-hydroxy-6-oxonona-2,4-dienedioate hydrolase
MAALGDSFDIIAPDLPGFAGSRDEPVAASIKELSRAQVALLDTLGIDKFHLLGHSMGGMVALQTALDHPARVEKLVLYATNSSGDLPGRFETFEQTCERVETDGVARVAAYVTATWFHDREAAPMYPFCLGSGAGASKAAVLAGLRAFGGWDVTDRLSELKMPVLVIGGDKDRSYDLDGFLRMTEAIQSAEFCLLAGCAHCAHLEQSDPFNAVVRKFLSAR